MTFLVVCVLVQFMSFAFCFVVCSSSPCWNLRMQGAAKFLELLPWLGVHWCSADKGFWACGERSGDGADLRWRFLVLGHDVYRSGPLRIRLPPRSSTRHLPRSLWAGRHFDKPAGRNLRRNHAAPLSGMLRWFLVNGCQIDEGLRFVELGGVAVEAVVGRGRSGFGRAGGSVCGAWPTMGTLVPSDGSWHRWWCG